MTKEEVKEHEQIYVDILIDAQIKRKEHKTLIRKNCCPFCCNINEDCFQMDYNFKNGIETYKCKNFKKWSVL
jgi:hypothetical protein